MRGRLHRLLQQACRLCLACFVLERAQRRMQHGGLLGDRLRWGVATPILQRAKLRKRKHMPPQTRG